MQLGPELKNAEATTEEPRFNISSHGISLRDQTRPSFINEQNKNQELSNKKESPIRVWSQ